MQYRIDKKSGKRLSVLGFGCMRFPRSGVSVSGVIASGAIDYEKTRAVVKRALDEGVNYFDTAYLYPGSEEILGRIFQEEGVRENINIATKLPVILCKQNADFEKFFAKQLERLRTQYVDYYLLHMLTDFGKWQRLKEMGVVEWLEKNKKMGAMKQIGFSFHGMRDEFMKILDDYDWDFCQIQYNYSNENYQAGTAGLRKAAEKGIPVIIMEPLLGGKLARNLPPDAARVFKEASSKASSESTPAEWALRWLFDKEEVTVVLSGMTTSGDLEENLRIASKYGAGNVTEGDKAVYDKAIEAFRAADKVPCTGCAYCQPCPRGVDIPACFASYNASFSFGRIQGWQQYLTSAALTSKKPAFASACVKCKKCETHCPQNIKIADSLTLVKKRMEPFWFSLVIKIARLVTKS